MKRTYALLAASTAISSGIFLLFLVFTELSGTMTDDGTIRQVIGAVTQAGVLWGVFAFDVDRRGVCDARSWWLRPHRSFVAVIRSMLEFTRSTPTPR